MLRNWTFETKWHWPTKATFPSKSSWSILFLAFYSTICRNKETLGCCQHVHCFNCLHACNRLWAKHICNITGLMTVAALVNLPKWTETTFMLWCFVFFCCLLGSCLLFHNCKCRGKATLPFWVATTKQLFFFTSNFLFHNTLWTRVWKRCPADVVPDSFCNLCIALLILHLLCNSCFVKRRRQHLCLLYSWWIVCLLRTLQKSLKEGAWYRVQLRFCCALAVNRICCTSGQK